MQKNKYLTLNIEPSLQSMLLLSTYLIASVLLPFLVMNVFSHSFMRGKVYAIFLSTALALGILAFTSLPLYFVRFSHRTKYLIGALLSVLILNYFFHDISPFYIETYERIVFWSLVFFFSALLMTIQKESRILIFLPLLFGLTVFIILVPRIIRSAPWSLA